jgi:lipopolysaccharide transport system ATP-binding protein
MDAAADNGSRPVAVDAHGLCKRYRLGELSSLQHTARRLIGKPDRDARPDLEALAGVEFTVFRGESLGIVGTNGSGKSTLLQILAGTTVPTSGHADVHGRVLPLLAVGAGFHGELTGRENVTLLGASLGIPHTAIRDRMDAVADFAELERHMDTPVKRYSSGMLSRLSFAIAMQFPADIYIFDEVLAVVDGEFQARCLDAIRGLHREGRTVIFVSHSLRQVAEVCERVMWLDGGRLARVGPTTEVLDAYTAAHSGP